MAKNDYEGPEAAKLEDADEVYHNIKFRKDKKGIILKFLCKAFVFILISSLSGVIAAYYFTDYTLSRYSDNSTDPKKSMGLYNHNIYNDNLITKTAEDIGPAIVAISNKKEGCFDVSDTDCSSGLIFNKNGYIVTSYHSIENAKKITVKLSSGKILEGKFIGADKVTDLAVIKINAANLPTVKFGDFSKVKVGETAIAVGNPFGDEYDACVSVGIVGGINRKLQYGEATYKLIQTDAVINQGNSGGALCNEKEEVIGINSSMSGSMYGNEKGLGFAISINDARDIITDLINHGRISKPSMGIIGKDVPLDNEEEENAQSEAVYISEVLPESGAYYAGIREGDILLMIDTEKVYDIDQLSDIMDRYSIGDIVTCKIERDKATMKIKVKLTERKIKK